MINRILSGLLLLVSLDGLSRENAGECVEIDRQDQYKKIFMSSADTILDTKRVDKAFVPVPRMAVKLALIPGGGQIYNRDYWKLSIVYLSLAGGIYAYHLNQIKYQDFLTAYKSFYNLEKGTDGYGQLKPGVTTDTPVNVRIRNLFNTKSEYMDLTKDVIERQKDYWRRNRNLSIIVTGLIYTLSIIEANVAAHMRTFDLSDDLTIRIEPKISQPLIREPVPGFRFVMGFK